MIVNTSVQILNNEDGFVLVLAILIMVVLSVIGISSTRTSTIEVRIAGNEKVIKQNFYSAESAVYVGAQVVENNNANLLDTLPLPNGLNRESAMPANFYTGNSIYANATWGNNGTIYASSNGTLPNSSYIVIDRGVTKDEEAGSLDMSESQIHEFDVYGLGTNQNGMSMINIGYKKRF